MSIEIRTYELKRVIFFIFLRNPSCSPHTQTPPEVQELEGKPSSGTYSTSTIKMWWQLKLLDLQEFERSQLVMRYLRVYSPVSPNKLQTASSTISRRRMVSFEGTMYRLILPGESTTRPGVMLVPRAPGAGPARGARPHLPKPAPTLHVLTRQ